MGAISSNPGVLPVRVGATMPATTSAPRMVTGSKLPPCPTVPTPAVGRGTPIDFSARQGLSSPGRQQLLVEQPRASAQREGRAGGPGDSLISTAALDGSSIRGVWQS